MPQPFACGAIPCCRRCSSLPQPYYSSTVIRATCATRCWDQPSSSQAYPCSISSNGGRRRSPGPFPLINLFAYRVPARTRRCFLPRVLLAPNTAIFLPFRNRTHALRVCTFHLHLLPPV